MRGFLPSPFSVHLPCLEIVAREMRALATVGLGVRKVRLRLLLLLLSSYFTLPIDTQARHIPVGPESPYLIDAWETEEGLPENSATSFMQTPDGYVWFGTFNGLVRFDGIRFEIMDRSNLPGLPSPSVISMHLDAKGRRWFGTDRGIARWDPDNTWHRYGPDEGWLGGVPRRFLESPSGDLFVTGWEGGLFQMRNDRFQRLAEPPLDPSVTDKTVAVYTYLERGGVLWGVNNKFLGRWDGTRWIPVGGQPWKRWASFDNVGAGRTSGVWVSTRTNLSQYVEGRLTRSLDLSKELNNSWEIREDPDGKIYAASYIGGLSIVNTNGQVDLLSSTNGLTHNSLRFTARDRDQGIWVGSSGGGLILMRPRNFVSYGRETGLADPVTKSLVELRPNVMLLGSHGRGLHVLSNGVAQPFLNHTNARIGPYAWSMLRDHRGDVWVGKYDKGLSRLSGNTEFGIPTNQIGGATVAALFEDSRRRLWVGTDKSIAMRRDDGFQVFGRGNGIANGNIRCFAEDSARSRIYAGSYDGGVYQTDTTAPNQWTLVPGTSELSAWAIHVGEDGALWIGTFGKGLVHADATEVEAFDERRGLPTHNITSVLEDRLGNLWLGSNRGILRVALRELHQALKAPSRKVLCQQFGLEDGMQSLECAGGHQPSAIEDSSGRLWFSTLKGVVHVDPRRLQLNNVPPQVLIERLVADGQPLFQRAPLKVQSADGRATAVATAAAGTERIECSFTAIRFGVADRIQFRMKVEGLDREWREVGVRRAAYLTHPPPGSYTIRVQARDGHGDWSEPGAQVAFSVEPYLWQRWWFRGMGVAALIGVGAGGSRAVFRARLQRELKDIETQRQLSQYETRLASVLESTNDLIAFVDPEGGLSYINQAGRRMLGLSADESVKSMLYHEVVNRRLWRYIRKTVAPLTRRGEPWSGELLMGSRSTKDLMIAACTVSSFRRPDGDLEYICVMARDVTEHRRAEAARRESDARFRSVVDTMAEGVLLVNRVHAVMSANASALHILGHPTGASEHAVELLPWAAFDDQDAPITEQNQPHQIVLRTGEGCAGIQLAVRRPDGSRRWLSVNAQPLLRDAETLPDDVVVTFTDITEKRQAELAERQLRELYAALVNTVDGVVWESDPLQLNYRFVSQRAEALLGYPVREWTENPRFWMERLHPDDRETAIRACAESTRSQQDHSLEYRLVARDGRVVWVHDAVSVVSKGGVLIALRGILIDISARKLAEEKQKHLEEQLRQAQKIEAIGQLAGGIAHDFNNILASTTMNLSLMRIQHWVHPAGADTLRELLVDTQRATALVRQLMAFGRRSLLQLRVLDVNEVISQLLKMLQRLLGENVAVRFDPGTGLSPVFADVGSLEQLLTNLAVNARDAMTEGGRLTIRTFGRAEEADPNSGNAAPRAFTCLMVEDTGTGMSEEVRSRIFEPFFTTKPVGRGTGLGLSTVHGIVLQHKGRIEVESEPGKGTRFIVSLPATEGTPKTTTPAEPSLAEGRTGTILLVEDQDSVRVAATKLLTRLGYRVLTASTAEGAMKVWSEESSYIDLLITDMVMPGKMTGLDLIGRLRESQPGLRAILSSGYSVELSHTRDAEAPNIVLLSKPYTLSELDVALRQCLSAVV